MSPKSAKCFTKKASVWWNEACLFDKRESMIDTPLSLSPLCNTLQHTATHCNTLQHTATHCNTLQHTATHCNTRERGEIYHIERGIYHTGRRGCLILLGHLLQKSPIISGSFAERDLRLSVVSSEKRRVYFTKERCLFHKGGLSLSLKSAVSFAKEHSIL